MRASAFCIGMFWCVSALASHSYGGAVLMAQARGSYQPAALEDAEKQFLKMKTRHLKNVYLGIAYQSPDYQ